MPDMHHMEGQCEQAPRYNVKYIIIFDFIKFRLLCFIKLYSQLLYLTTDISYVKYLTTWGVNYNYIRV
jgi:hypothetical protein